MKSDEDLLKIARRVHGEVELGMTDHGFEKETVKRLRQLEHDAILDFLETVAERSGMVHSFHPGHMHADGPYADAMRASMLQYGIKRAPDGGCKDGRCGSKRTFARCMKCNRPYDYMWWSISIGKTCICGGIVEKEQL